MPVTWRDAGYSGGGRELGAREVLIQELLPVIDPAGGECCPPLACAPLLPGGADELAPLFKALADPMRCR